MDTARQREIEDSIRRDVDRSVEPIEQQPDNFWRALHDQGTELWLDTGDIEAASAVWSAEMRALTTNNTLLNREIQKGIYDDYIREARAVVADLPPERQVIEIAFMLNAHHALRLVRRFNAMVSVELHTDLAHNYEGIVDFGQRFFRIAPDNFYVKVPFTPAGILGARRLRELGVRINCTLEFSARQNALVAAAAHPDCVNVFLGRIGAYFAHNKLGDGVFAGERATLASQRAVTALTGSRKTPTRQIAASLRSAEQIALLAGVDIMTMPAKVARAARAELKPDFYSRREEIYTVVFDDATDSQALRADTLWHVPDALLELAAALDRTAPETANELVERVRDAGFHDLFPTLSPEDHTAIAANGKIPDHARWAKRIATGELAIDTLLNLAGLASFAADQQALDDRIRSLLD
jgi:transaldolase